MVHIAGKFPTVWATRKTYLYQFPDMISIFACLHPYSLHILNKSDSHCSQLGHRWSQRNTAQVIFIHFWAWENQKDGTSALRIHPENTKAEETVRFPSCSIFHFLLVGNRSNALLKGYVQFKWSVCYYDCVTTDIELLILWIPYPRWMLINEGCVFLLSMFTLFFRPD